MGRMRARRFLASAFLLACATPVAAESLQCNGSLASEGDSRLSLLYKCGEPVLKDSWCAPVYQRGSPYPVPEPFARTLAPCIVIEEWLYDRGPGNLMAQVRFRGGVIESIRYGHTPR